MDDSIPGRSLVLNVADCDLVTLGLLLVLTNLFDVTTESADLTLGDFCGSFDLVTTTGSGKFSWLGKLQGIDSLLILSTDDVRVGGSCVLLTGQVVLKDCAVGMLVIGRWLETDSESV